MRAARFSGFGCFLSHNDFLFFDELISIAVTDRTRKHITCHRLSTNPILSVTLSLFLCLPLSLFIYLSHSLLSFSPSSLIFQISSYLYFHFLFLVLMVHMLFLSFSSFSSRSNFPLSSFIIYFHLPCYYFDSNFLFPFNFPSSCVFFLITSFHFLCYFFDLNIPFFLLIFPLLRVRNEFSLFFVFTILYFFYFLSFQFFFFLVMLNGLLTVHAFFLICSPSISFFSLLFDDKFSYGHSFFSHFFYTLLLIFFFSSFIFWVYLFNISEDVFSSFIAFFYYIFIGIFIFPSFFVIIFSQYSFPFSRFSVLLVSFSSILDLLFFLRSHIRSFLLHDMHSYSMSSFFTLCPAFAFDGFVHISCQHNLNPEGKDKEKRKTRPANFKNAKDVQYGIKGLKS
ncbi:unnamed protein product [Acanthosepion pharaonis]|uniref:Uncharacterized protein n=1 Tax=Acanthosepion pharaonis TaxID=158019 RepID=A0A812ERK6_ACAPH|nr:unnamed protein product [Sepia pharaonis]